MAKNPNSSENKMKIKQKRKRSNSQDQPAQLQDEEEEEALEIDTIHTSEFCFESLNLSEPTLKAINDMQFTHTTQVL